MPRPDYYGNPAGLTQDIDIVRAIYGAFAVRDLEGALDFVDPECEIHVDVTARAAGRQGPYVGHDGLRRYFADVEAVWQKLEIRADDFRVIPGSVVVMGHVEGRGYEGPFRRAAHVDLAARERARDVPARDGPRSGRPGGVESRACCASSATAFRPCSSSRASCC